MNCVLSSLLTEEREIEGLKRQPKKKKKRCGIYIYIFLDELVLFIMDLLYWDPILEALSFYGKKIWALFKKKN
jgi:hypothetical protein